MSDSSEEKNKPATRKKLAQQREKGVVAQSAELSNYLSQVLALLFLILASEWILAAMELGIDGAILVMAEPVEAVISDATIDSMRIYTFTAVPVAFLALASSIIVTIIYQKGFLFATDPLTLKLERLSLTSGLKRMFGKRGWVELAVSIMRVAVWGGTFAGILLFRLETIIASTLCGLFCFVDVALGTLLLIFTAAIILFLVFALLEGLIQGILFSDDQKMTQTDVKREKKDQFGSPEVRSSRKKFRKELEREAEASGVDNATMAIFAGSMVVAIRYHPTLAPTPMVAATGKTSTESRRIRARLRDNGYLETEHYGFVQGVLGVRNGKPVPAALYDHLREALHQMYA